MSEIMALEEDGEWIEKEDALRGDDEKNDERDQNDGDKGGHDNREDEVKMVAGDEIEDEGDEVQDVGGHDDVDEVKRDACDGMTDDHDDGDEGGIKIGKMRSR